MVSSSMFVEGMKLESRKTPKTNLRTDILHSARDGETIPQSITCFISHEVSFNFNCVIVQFQIGTMAVLHSGRGTKQNI